MEPIVAACENACKSKDTTTIKLHFGAVMDKAEASLIMQSALACESGINPLFEQIRSLKECEEKKRLVQAIGDIMQILTIDIVLPIATNEVVLVVWTKKRRSLDGAAG